MTQLLPKSLLEGWLGRLRGTQWGGILSNLERSWRLLWSQIRTLGDPRVMALWVFLLPSGFSDSHLHPFACLFHLWLYLRDLEQWFYGLLFSKVTFKDPEAAMRACQNPSPVIDGRRANCNLASLGANKNRPPTFQHGPIPHILLYLICSSFFLIMLYHFFINVFFNCSNISFVEFTLQFLQTSLSFLVIFHLGRFNSS